MSKFETSFRNAVATAERDVLLAQIRQNPQMSLADLAGLTTGALGPLVRNLTIGDLLGSGSGSGTGGGKARAVSTRSAPAAKPAGGKAPKAKVEKKAKPEKAEKKAKPEKAEKKAKPEKAEKAEAAPKTGRGSKGVVDTRTPAGREAFDKAILEVVKGAPSPISAEEIRKVVGGTPLQARVALGRLIEGGHLTWTGQARGTRYTVAA